MRFFDTGIDYSTIELIGMEFHAFHGCLEKEKREGNLFVVNFKGELTSIDKAVDTDSLDYTVDGNKIYNVINKEMSRRCNLLETVAGHILEAVKNEFPDRFLSIELSVSKHNPPLQGKCEWSRVTVKWGM